MKNVLQKLTATSAAILLVMAVPAQAAGKADVAKARSECAAHKQTVHSLESKGKSDALAKAKAEWEDACQRAEVLINEANGTKPPAVVAPTAS